LETEKVEESIYVITGKSKYKNRRVSTPEGVFDSQKEYRRWCELKLLEKAGQIQELRRQVSFELIPKIGRMRAIRYVADFVYTKNGGQVVEDSKGGVKTRLYMLKWRLMHWRHGIQVLET
jgi:hypothetical protein